MLRVTSGTAKNKKLDIPKVEGFRAVQEVAKLAIFAILGDRVLESNCLDLYAGSGNMGIEALSRGASHCDFVDESWNSKQVIQKNLKNCGFEDKGTIFLSDSVKYAANTEEKYDIIFCDPFYQNHSHKFLFKNLKEILHPDGIIAFLHDPKLDLRPLIEGSGLVADPQRRFGKSAVTMLK